MIATPAVKRGEHLDVAQDDLTGRHENDGRGGVDGPSAIGDRHTAVDHARGISQFPGGGLWEEKKTLKAAGHSVPTGGGGVQWPQSINPLSKLHPPYVPGGFSQLKAGKSGRAGKRRLADPAGGGGGDIGGYLGNCGKIADCRKIDIGNIYTFLGHKKSPPPGNFSKIGGCFEPLFTVLFQTKKVKKFAF